DRGPFIAHHYMELPESLLRDKSGRLEEHRDRILFEDNPTALALFGVGNANLKTIERDVGVSLSVRGGEVTIAGDRDRVGLARSLLEQLYGMARRGMTLEPRDISQAVRVVSSDQNAALKEVMNDLVIIGSRARPIRPKSIAQKHYVEAIREKDIVFG